jgi:hypothetical protein
MSTIEEYQFAELLRGVGAMRQPLETLPAEFGEIAGVIEMAVSEKNPFYGIGRHREFLPVSQPVLLGPLEHTAIYEKPSIANIEHMSRTGGGTGSAPENQFAHEFIYLSYIY